VVWRSRSLLTGVLTHFVLNGSVVLFETGHAPAWVEEYMHDRFSEETGFGVWVVLAALFVFAIGVALMEWTRGAAEVEREA